MMKKEWVVLLILLVVLNILIVNSEEKFIIKDNNVIHLSNISNSKNFLKYSNISKGTNDFNIVENGVIKKINNLDEITYDDGIDSKIKTEINSYIIELKNPSIIEMENKRKFERGIYSVQDQKKFNQVLSNYKNELKSEHSKALIDFEAKLKEDELASLNIVDKLIEFFKRIFRFSGFVAYDNELKPEREFFNTFNGIVLTSTKDDIEKIKESKYVKNIYRNLEVKAVLSGSVPVIRADKVWELEDAKGDKITGKDVTIAIIDTGIDYTHDDFAGNYYDALERNFTKINLQPINGYDEGFDQQFVINGNELAYYSGSNLSVYNFEKNETRIINLNIDRIIRLGFDGEYIAYYAKEKEADLPGIFVYNLKTDENKKILDAINLVSYIFVSEGKIIYDNIDSNEIIIYDIVSGNTISLKDDSGYVDIPAVSGNIVVFPVYSDKCYDKTIIYDMNSEERKEITPTNLGTIYDVKDGKILYEECIKEDVPVSKLKTYHYYDYNTQEDIILKFPEKESEIVSSSFYGVRSLKYKGVIGDNVVYFSKDIIANKIIAYDLISKKYSKINLYKSSGAIDADGKRICFLSKDIFCHEYNPDYSYPELLNVFNEKVVDGYDFVNNDNNPMDDHGHGTHVAGIAAGKGIDKDNDGIYCEFKEGEICGVAPDAKLYAFKVLDNRGSGSFDNIIAAIERAVDPNQDGEFSDHVDIISMSLGLDCKTYFGEYNKECGPEDPISKAVDNAVDKGVVVVISAGNEGPILETIGSPGTARKAITVGASDYDYLTSFSSRGPVKWIDENGNKKFLLKPEVVAPGYYICSSRHGSVFPERKCLDDEHISISGTSMAAPHVAGAVALLKQKYPEYSPLKIKSQLENNAKTLIDPSKDIYKTFFSEGHGRIDIYNSILENTPEINFDINSDKDSNVINLNGEIIGNIKNYSIYYKEIDDNEWKKLVSKSNINTISESFNSFLLDSGYLIFRLEVYDNNDKMFYKELMSIVENIVVSTPGKYGYLIENEKIFAEVSNSDYINYDIYLVNVSDNNELLVFSSQNTLKSGEIAEINMDNINNGKYKLIIKAKHSSGVIVKSFPIKVIVFKELRNGMIGFSEYTNPFFLSVNNLNGKNKNILYQTEKWVPIGGGWFTIEDMILEMWSKDSISQRINKNTNLWKGNEKYSLGNLNVYGIIKEGKDYLILKNALGNDRLGIIDENMNYINLWPIQFQNVRFDIFHGSKLSVFNNKIYSIYNWENLNLIKTNPEAYWDSRIFNIKSHDKFGNPINDITFKQFKDLKEFPRSYSYSSSPKLFFIKESPSSFGLVYSGNIEYTYNAEEKKKMWADLMIYDENGGIILTKDLLTEYIHDFSWIDNVLTGDIDNDGNSEIIISYFYLNESLYDENILNPDVYTETILILDSNGNLKYPKIIFKGYSLFNDLIITEENNLKYLILPLSGTFATDSVDRIAIINHNGEIISSLNLDPDEIIGEVVSGDIDNDGFSEVIFTNGPRWWGRDSIKRIRGTHIRIIDLNGNIEKDFKLESKDFFNVFSQMVLEDYNDDKKLDLTLVGDSMDVDAIPQNLTVLNLDLNTDYNRSKIYWKQRYGNAQRNNCYNCDKITSKPYLELNSVVKKNDPVSITIRFKNDNSEQLKYSVLISKCQFIDRETCNYETIKEDDILLDKNSDYEYSISYTPNEVGEYVIKLVSDINGETFADYYSLFSLELYADIYISSVIPEIITQGQETEFQFYLENSGNVNSKVNISFYYQDFFCDEPIEETMDNNAVRKSGEEGGSGGGGGGGGGGSGDKKCNDLILIEEKNETIERGDHKIVTFKWTPNILGEIYLVLIVNATNNINEFNQLRYYAEILPQGPNPGIYHDYSNYNEEILTGKKYNQSIILRNVGSEDAFDVNISLYISNIKNQYTENENVKNEEFNIIDSILVDKIKVGEFKLMNISWVSEKSGETILSVNISSLNDVSTRNNKLTYYYTIVEDIIDLKIKDIYSFKPIINNKNFIYLTIENLGRKVDNANLSLYDNENLIGNKSSYISSRYPSSEYFEWSPLDKGDHNLRAVIKTEGDINSTNDALEKIVHVFEKINVTFAMKNSLNEYIKNYIYSDLFDRNNEGLILVDGIKEISIQNLSETNETFIFGVVKLNDIKDLQRGEIIGNIYNSSFDNNITIISEFYDVVLQGEDKYYAVYVTKSSTDILDSQIYFRMLANYFSNLGINNLDEDYDVYYCSDFNFTNKNCNNEWKESIINGYWFDEQKGLVYEASAKERAEAFGITKIKEDVCGNLTNYDDIVSNFSCEDNVHGKVKFYGDINILRFKGKKASLNRYIRIKDKTIIINSNELYELKNIPAEILFKNINFQNPKIIYEDWEGERECPEDICSNVVYNRDEQILLVNVSHLSEFKVVEGEYCGDSICQSNKNEACNICVADCGVCSGDGGGGGGGGGGGRGGIVGNKKSCTPDWNCSWGPCENNIQKYICKDMKQCEVKINITSNRTCFKDSNCIDIDKDGYGIGIDCLGTDSNDNDPAITKEIPKSESKTRLIKKNYLIYVIISILVLVIIFALFYFYHRKRNLQHLKDKSISNRLSKQQLK